MPARNTKSNTKSITKPSRTPYAKPKSKPIQPSTLLSLGLKPTKIKTETSKEKNQRKKAENEMKNRYANHKDIDPNALELLDQDARITRALELLDQDSPSSSLPEIGQSIRKVRFANGRFPARTERRSRSKDPNIPKDNISLFKPYKALLGRSSDNITTIDSLRTARKPLSWPLREAEAKMDAKAARNIQRIARGHAARSTARAKKGKNGARMAAAEVEARAREKEPEVEELVDKMKSLTLSNSSNKKRRMGALLGANKALRKQKKSKQMNIARNDKA